MAGRTVSEIDVPPGHLLRWLAAEIARPDGAALALRATRDWAVEQAEGVADGADRLDGEDGLTSHAAFGTLEVAPRDGGGWTLVMEVSDPLGAAFGPDWPPDDADGDGPEEIPFESFVEAFADDDLDATVTVTAESPAARRAADRLVARLLADRHGRS